MSSEFKFKVHHNHTVDVAPMSTTVIENNMTEGFLTLSNTRNILTTDWEVGWQEVDETEREGILTWGRYINRFSTICCRSTLNQGFGLIQMAVHASILKRNLN